MNALLLALRPLAVLAVLLLLALFEYHRPRRLDAPQRRQRWPANLGLGATGVLLLVGLPLAPVATAAWAQSEGLGLGPWLNLPTALQWLLTLLALDLAVYAQHRLLHEWPVLWPLHRVHHADPVLDLSTGVRFHPLELLLSQIWKCLVVLLLGAPPLAVLAFEALLALGALWTHANVGIPEVWDARLRRLIVTPDVHRVHHSVHREEHDRNYGTLLLLWDRLFKSYCPHPREGHLRMKIGLREFRTPDQQRWLALLKHPWLQGVETPIGYDQSKRPRA